MIKAGGINDGEGQPTLEYENETLMKIKVKERKDNDNERKYEQCRIEEVV